MSMIKYFEDAGTDFFFIFHSNCILVKTPMTAGGLADELPDADIYKNALTTKLLKTGSQNHRIVMPQ